MDSVYEKLTQQQLNILQCENGANAQPITYTKNPEIVSLTITNNSSNSPTHSLQLLQRGNWNKDIEFLFSCIALSVGLGNVWRFPFIALENGGGAFVIPYIIVLVLIGRPVYYMEVILGQFSSRSCIKAFDMAPMMRGIAYGQVFSTGLATTYYSCIMALTIKYIVSSFNAILPWTYCKPEWGPNCVATHNISSSPGNSTIKMVSSAELFFTKTVLNEVENLEDGLGPINWDLVCCLFLTWVIIATVLIKGIQSSGKASYFLASFPYVIMFVLFCRAMTLPGSLDGIIYFLKPQWNQLLNAKVWYAAITQMFFSLAICFGNLIMYASFNNFRRNIHRDVIIITSVDSATSIFAGCIIFGILGNLAYETGTKDVSSVVKAGAGLAFISYPEAIAKFKYLPQVFSVLFFCMLLSLGIGSNIGMVSCVTTVIKDRFNRFPHWLLASGFSVFGFFFGLIYTTSGGQFILNLIDFYGCSFIALFLAIAEIFTIAWIYGVKRFCEDIEFMLHIKTGRYWRICWAIVTPGLMFFVLVYTLITYQPLDYKNIKYPDSITAFGWLIWAIGIAQLPLWALYSVFKQDGDTLWQKIKNAAQPSPNWGPRDPKTLEEYKQHRMNLSSKVTLKQNAWQSFLDNIFG